MQTIAIWRRLWYFYDVVRLDFVTKRLLWEMSGRDVFPVIKWEVSNESVKPLKEQSYEKDNETIAT